MVSVLSPLSNSWIVIIIGLHIALNRTPNIDCYWGGSTQDVVLRVVLQKVLAGNLQTICIELESKIVCLWQSVAVSGKPWRYPLNRGRQG